MRRCRRLPTQIAADLGVSHATVSRWLSGEGIPGTRSYRKLAEYSGVPLEKVLSIVGHLPNVAEAVHPEWPEFREYARQMYPDELDDDLITMIEDLIERRRQKRYNSKKIPKWEVELWSYLSQGDGVHCPLYQSCRLRLGGEWCLSEHEEFFQLMNEFLDDEASDLTNPASIKFEFPACPHSGRIFKLVRKLAVKCRTKAGIDSPPVPADLITRADDNLPIEVRKIPLKAHHGAIWRLNDCWVVQLNVNDTPAGQRFTLYHEIFHILAHGKATPVFKKTSSSPEGSFNELLADHFAAIILMPEKQVEEKWVEVKDIDRMAAIFDVPRPVVWFSLKHQGLI